MPRAKPSVLLPRSLSRRQKAAVAFAADAALCVVTVALAYYLRLGIWTWPIGNQWAPFIAAPLLALPLFVSMSLYRAVFRYAGWHAIVTIVNAGIIYGCVFSAIFTFVGLPGVPRTLGIIQPILLVLGLVITRGLARFWLGGGYHGLRGVGERRRTLIYGAGRTGRQLASALASSGDMLVVGFIDDNRDLHGRELSGKRIYSSSNLAEVVARLNVAEIYLALPLLSRRRRNAIIETVRGTNTVVRTLPDLLDVANGRVTINDLRELDIDDLLGRDAVTPDVVMLASKITGRVVLVSGAGGSIGSELCRQVIAMGPQLLLLVEQSELALYDIHSELVRRSEAEGAAVRIVPLLASVRDEERMRDIFATWRPQTVYHAAAYKHVPLVEHNPVEGVRNNSLGTLSIARAAQANGVSDFVLISTDKAVRPTNVMGASKRVAELVLQALAAEDGSTRFSMVRFGNVLGSSGSVVPLFREQIRAGGPVTITHREMTRYFMTIPEAAQLVIQAGAMARGGEVFVLDMGDPVKVVHLARRMIELSGLSVCDEDEPDGDIEIEVVGMRPGEKLYEELLVGNNPEQTTHPRIMKAREAFIAWPQLKSRLGALEQAADKGDVAALGRLLCELVPEFTPQGDLSGWTVGELQRTG